MGVEVRDLRKEYPGFSVALDFDVADGETLVLAGPSGCGKTTALRLLAGLAEADGGELCIDGIDVADVPPWKRNAALVFQDLALFPHLSVGGNVAYGPAIRGVRRAERRRIVDECLAAVRLSGYRRRRVDTLSGGERQRTAIARALAASPRLLLMDEPFSSLDAPLRRELRREFRELRSRSSLPCVFVTHDRDEAASLADRIALMDAGRVVETGTARDLFLRPRTGFAARFFGSGAVVECRMVGGGGAAATVDGPLGRLRVPDSGVGRSGAAAADGKLLLFVPKDGMTLGRCASPAGGRYASCSGTLRGASFQGDHLALEIEAAEGVMLQLEAGCRAEIPPLGGVVEFAVDQELLRVVTD